VDLERREGDVDTYKVASAKYSSISHLAPVIAPAGGSREGKSAKARKADGEAEDPAKVARREEVMKKWAERKAAAGHLFRV
jgi:hypothetical protein